MPKGLLGGSSSSGRRLGQPPPRPVRGMGGSRRPGEGPGATSVRGEAITHAKGALLPARGASSVMDNGAYLVRRDRTVLRRPRWWLHPYHQKSRHVRATTRSDGRDRTGPGGDGDLRPIEHAGWLPREPKPRRRHASRSGSRRWRGRRQADAKAPKAPQRPRRVAALSVLKRYRLTEPISRAGLLGAAHGRRRSR